MGKQRPGRIFSPDLHTQVIKPTFATSARMNFQPAIGSLLNGEELQRWRERIDRQPDIYTTQSYSPLFQAPTWQENRIAPRGTAMMRVFIASPGWGRMGSAGRRNDPHRDGRPAHRFGCRAAAVPPDTWVMTNDPVGYLHHAAEREKLPALEHLRELVSQPFGRNLFWLGRYTERCEQMVRLAKEALVLVSTNQDSLPALNDAIGSLAQTHGLIPEVRRV